MARNEEKAQSMLNRFLKLKDSESKYEQRRPHLSSDCDSLVDAEKWRKQIIREISKGITDIQNSSIGEYKIRDLNDQINKLTREKYHWEKRILELGGANYRAIAPKITDANGKEPLGQGLYKYYGEARNLPGVKELFDKPEKLEIKRSKIELLKFVDSDYYGYRDDEDGALEQLEREYENYAIEKKVEEWKTEQKEKYQMKSTVRGATRSSRIKNDSDNDRMDTTDENNNNDINENNDLNTTTITQNQFKSHVPLPTKEELEQMILEKKKEELRKRYAQ
ncbi:hypothetical protein CYY_009118 [Polysphondylium violaceum]|uniref:Pre-mRNA-splicing factor ISY1 n=1 Tax=Polysphondylium violaceum TaxID=133409 RepID=A0A8J4PM44_9MYCE|nr:hypothetical protein CYY_009118 [Polysphondylium violaceum]